MGRAGAGRDVVHRRASERGSEVNSGASNSDPTSGMTHAQCPDVRDASGTETSTRDRDIWVTDSSGWTLPSTDVSDTRRVRATVMQKL